jgi:glycosyltransferase involved in cell wall biosynthesis
MNPKISILICTYNCEKYIENTLQTIFNQTYKDWELLILDNNSKDSTKKNLKKYKKNKKIKITYNKTNIGAYPGLNLLLDKAKGKYIAIQDHDDLWHPDKLTKQVDLLEKNKKYVGCATNFIEYFEKEKKYRLIKSPKKESFFVGHTTLLFRNNKKYRYDTNIKYGTDFNFMKNILCQNQKLIYVINSFYTVHLRPFSKTNLGDYWSKKMTYKEFTTINKHGIQHKNKLYNLVQYTISKLPSNIRWWVIINLQPKKYKSIKKINIPEWNYFKNLL